MPPIRITSPRHVFDFDQFSSSAWDLQRPIRIFQFDEASLNSTESSVRTITETDGSNTSNATSLNGIQIPQRDSRGIYEDHPGLDPSQERVVEYQGAIHEEMGRLMPGRDPSDVLAAAERVHGEGNDVEIIRGLFPEDPGEDLERICSELYRLFYLSPDLDLPTSWPIRDFTTLLILGDIDITPAYLSGRCVQQPL